MDVSTSNDSQGKEISLISTGDEAIFGHLSDFQSSLQLELSKVSNVQVEVSTIEGGLFPFQKEIKAREFGQSDYTSSSSLSYTSSLLLRVVAVAAIAATAVVAVRCQPASQHMNADVAFKQKIEQKMRERERRGGALSHVCVRQNNDSY